MSAPDRARVGLAPAKVNLVLEVVGRRADGYHEIDTILQTLALADGVTLRPGGPPGVSVTGPFAGGVPADETNLAWRAAVALGGIVGRPPGSLGIHLDKQIPAAGGLGGGASDAATVLRLLEAEWGGLPQAALLEAASSIGSDEAFFLLGGTARATGRGERVTPLPGLPPHGVVLFVPPGTIERKTASMFAALGRLPFEHACAAGEFTRHPPGRVTAGQVVNSFERVAFDVFPGLAGLQAGLEAAIGEPVRLAGAGPTLFWIGPTAQAAGVASAARGMDCTVIATETVGPQWR
ncbi:MAG: 4-(cytidine 5'-diphospho)-2-C-methyl-D-erythritol kinase [Thermoflexaceae bacterium]|nr:4-(cytidine 5'-diphospho)-2-C-methyl-D-erythritol kinase [Thermoflexaceae bacterium]